MSWPTLPNGTVDWDTVFMDPNSGLIAMIGRADTPDKLQACYHVTIQGLYSRKSDDEVREKYLDAIDQYFVTEQDDGQLIGLKTKIRMLLQRILHDRIERAAKYAKLKEAGDERRMPEDDPLTPLQVLNEAAALF